MSDIEPTEEQEEEQEETSLRDDLESAIVEETDAEEKEATDEATGEEKAPEKGNEDDKPADSAIGDAEGEKTPEGINAPIGFTPEAREQWKNVPDVVKAQIQAREKEITDTVANTGEYRRTHTAMTNLAQSYAPILAAEGASTPMEAVEGLFRTVAELRVGTPQQTAQKMADLIGHYGIDIKMLDSALSGTPMATPEQTAMEKMLDDRFAPFQRMMETQQQSGVDQRNANQTAINTELAEFSKDAEFLNDVRNDMADLIELASKRGEIMSFADAYAKSCAMHPGISKVMADRALVSGKEKINGKANASASLRSASADVSVPAGGGTLRDTISGLFDDYAE